MSKTEDIPPETTSYPYFWSPKSLHSLQDFLTKYRPSMVQDDGTKPWIWVQGKERPESNANEVKAIEEASEYLKEVTEKIEAIQSDDSIPVRANKKKGLKSKKEAREQVQEEAKEKLKEISIRHGYVVGKWLVFAPSEKVDVIWFSLANSISGGALSSSLAYIAKVATCPQTEQSNYQHVMCLYMPDVYDEDAVRDVMKVLLGDHGFTLSGVKSDLYTAIGIDSKHPSGIKSTIWQPNKLMKDTEIKGLKDAYFAKFKSDTSRPITTTGLGTSAVPAGSDAKDKPAPSGTVEPKNEGSTAGGANVLAAPAAKAKKEPKFKLKKKAEADDPFASDEDIGAELTKKATTSKTSTKPPSTAANKPASKSAKPANKAGTSIKPTSRAAGKARKEAKDDKAFDEEGVEAEREKVFEAMLGEKVGTEAKKRRAKRAGDEDEDKDEDEPQTTKKRRGAK